MSADEFSGLFVILGTETVQPLFVPLVIEILVFKKPARCYIYINNITLISKANSEKFSNILKVTEYLTDFRFNIGLLSSQ